MHNDSKMISGLFFRLLPVQILLVAIGSINSVIDGALASHFIGPEAMTVTGLYMPFMKILETINAVLLGGSQILCGQFLGKNQVERTKDVFSLDMILIVFTSLLFTAACFIFPNGLASALGADADNAGGLGYYLLGTAAGILPQMLGAQLSAFLQLEQQQKRTYIGIAVMMVTNAALDWLFIVVLNWGMFGLGLATAISCWAFFIVLGSYYFTKKAVIKFAPRGIRLKDLASIIRIGIPGAIVTLCLSIRGFAINAMLFRWSGAAGVAALSALNTFGGLLYSVTGGLASTTRLLVSVYAGEEDRVGTLQIMKTALIKGVGIVCAFALSVFLLAIPLTRVFYTDAESEVYRLTVMLFRIYPLCMPLSAICVIFINYNQSMSRMGIVNVLSVMDGVAGVCLVSVILAPFMGALGVWIAHVMNGVLTTAAIVIYSWIRSKRFPTSIEKLLSMPEGFGVPPEHSLAISIRCREEVVNASESIIDFCRGIGLDERTSFHAGLCLEELAANVVEHGFCDGKKHTAEIRVVDKADSLMLRVKDDCRAFDPREAAEMMDPKDIAHNVGLRIVRKTAKSMCYNSALGLNVLTIELLRPERQTA